LWIAFDRLKRRSALKDTIRPVKPMIRLLRRSKSLKGMRQNGIIADT
jgi:hypothetical protein